MLGYREKTTENKCRNLSNISAVTLLALCYFGMKNPRDKSRITQGV
jgi:hypothetical protein